MPRAYRNFRAAIYVTVTTPSGSPIRRRSTATSRASPRSSSSTRSISRPIAIGSSRPTPSSTPSSASSKRKAFRPRAEITLAAGGSGGQFGTFDYENPADRAECERAVRLIARHFDEVILDDFFFYTSKSDADIAAKGNRSWTDYRIAKMREVSRDLVLGPAHQENPRARVIIKYPNWYEHFHGLGFDLAEQPHMFDGIYTGTETRDPVITDQLLQQYESYEIYRYFSNIRPGGESRRLGRHLQHPRDRPLRRAAVGYACSQKRRNRPCSSGARWRATSRRRRARGLGRSRRRASLGLRNRAAAGRLRRTRRYTLSTTCLGSSGIRSASRATVRRTGRARTSCTITSATSAYRLSSIRHIRRTRTRSC